MLTILPATPSKPPTRTSTHQDHEPYGSRAYAARATPSHTERFPSASRNLRFAHAIRHPGVSPQIRGRCSNTVQAIVSDCTNKNLLLKSFYDAKVRGKVFDRTKCVLSTLADNGISRCAFTSTFGMMQGQSWLNDQTAPQFKVDGLSRVPFMHQGYFFSPGFLICNHIFCRQEYETQFVAILSLDFLWEYFIRAQFHKKGWMIQLPPPPLV